MLPDLRALEGKAEKHCMRVAGLENEVTQCHCYYAPAILLGSSAKTATCLCVSGTLQGYI